MDDSEVEGLYALAPEQFVAARDQLARRLRSEGRRQEAAQVRALARPTVPAWALNQLARSFPAEIEVLVAVGAELRSAQDRALSGRGGAQLRQAGERRREAVKALTERAGALLSDAGRDPAAHLAAIASALEAAAVDEEAAAALCAGRLSKPPERQSGFAESGFPDPTELAPAPAAPPAPIEPPAAEDEQRKAAEQAHEQARERAEEAQGQADAALLVARESSQQAQAAVAEVARLEDLLERARTAAREATKRAATAEESAAAAREQAARLADALAEARADLERVGGSPPL